MSPKYKVAPDRDYTIWQLPSSDEKTRMGYIISACDGRCFVIDGGCDSDRELLLAEIREKCGGKVSAWLVTHPHPGHIGALCAILEDFPRDIEIKKIFYVPINVDNVEKYEPESLAFVKRWMLAVKGFGNKVSVAAGDRIKIGRTVVRVIAAGDNGSYKENYINNSGAVYKFDMFCTSVLFLGDIGRDASIALLESKDSKNMLNCDIVQIANHGRPGIISEVYHFASPDICLWSAPKCFLAEDSEYYGYNYELRSILRDAFGARNYEDCSEIVEIKIEY